jgi:hypothetical protein
MTTLSRCVKGVRCSAGRLPALIFYGKFCFSGAV